MLLALHAEAAPSEAEWDKYLDAMPGVLAHPNGVGMVLTDGGTPSTAQRERMRKKDAGAVRCNAIITDRAIVRGVVTAVSWFNPKVCAFAPREFPQAFSFVGLSGAQIASVCATLEQLNHGLSPKSRVLSEALQHIQLAAHHHTEAP